MLVKSVAELDNDVVDHARQPRVKQQQGQRVAVSLEAVDLAQPDQPVGVERLQNRVGEPAGGRWRFATASGGWRQARDRSGSEPGGGGGLDESPSSGL